MAVFGVFHYNVDRSLSEALGEVLYATRDW